MDWKQQFEILNKIIYEQLSKTGAKPSLKRAAEYLGVPAHKYLAWKEGQAPVVDDLRRLAQEFEFRAEWLLLGIGQPRQARRSGALEPRYVDICDTLHDLVASLPEPLPQVAEAGGMTTTDLYDCIHSQAFPPTDAVAKWIRRYRINANFLLAQIGQPYLSEEQYHESGSLEAFREQRGDFLPAGNPVKADPDTADQLITLREKLIAVQEKVIKEQERSIDLARQLQEALQAAPPRGGGEGRTVALLQTAPGIAPETN